MSKIVDESGLARALDRVSTSAVYYSNSSGDIITPNTRCYTKQEVDNKLQVLQDEKLNRAEYDKTLEEVIRVTGYNDIEEFSEAKTYYQGDLVKRKEVDSKGNVVWVYYRYTKFHSPSIFITSDCVQSNLYSEIQSLKLSDVETIYLYISTEKGDITLSDYHITYKYDEQIYYADIDTNGEVQFQIPKGKNYIIIFPQFPGYTPKESMYLYASINTKSLNIYYQVLKEEVETVTIKGLVYNASGVEVSDEDKQQILENAEFTLVIDGETKEVKKFDSLSLITYFKVPIGKYYTIKCNNVSKYVSATSTVKELANLNTKRFEFKYVYIGEDSGWIAISKSGILYNVDTISGYSEEELKSLNIVALRLSNSVLSTNNYTAAFWIPLEYIYNGDWRLVTNYNSGSWYKSNIQLDTTILPNCTTSITKIQGYYPSVDGQQNTNKLRFLAARSTYTDKEYWKEFKQFSRIQEVESDFPEIIQSQTCGESAYWNVSNNALYIMGNGGVTSYNTFENTPWSDQVGKISSIYIGSNIENIGDNCFSGFTTGGGIELTKVVCFAVTPPNISSTTFNTSIFNTILYVPEDTYTIQDSNIISICDKCSLPIDGYDCTPFIGAINQYVQLQANRAVFQNFYLKWYKAKYGVAGSISYPNSGFFWSSSQGNATYAWDLYLGSAGTYYKTSSGNVVPFFALSPQAVANS